jgi:hypothetical protein
VAEIRKSKRQFNGGGQFGLRRQAKRDAAFQDASALGVTFENL